MNNATISAMMAPNVSPASIKSSGNGAKIAANPMPIAIHTPSNNRSTMIEGRIETKLALIHREAR